VSPAAPGGAAKADVYCRNCGVRLRRLLGRWWHVQNVGPVQCPGAEPEER
jgi:hypothetical protein